MRSLLAGLLIFVLTATSFGQVRGEVESIGFGSPGYFRPQCWTPMVVRLQSLISEPAEYRIEVHQRDLDFDHVIYVKDGITLNGQATQKWEICFMPEPIHGGLSGRNLPDLQDRLRVYLTNKEGTRQLIQLPITSTMQSLEGASDGFTHHKAGRLVLMIADEGSRPALSLGSYDGAIGLSEIPVPVRLRPAELPQSALAYHAVDAVMWLSGDAHVLTEQGSKQLTALQQWLRQGGSLIVCQAGADAERQRIEPFADMLPIVWKENGEWKLTVRQKNDLQPLTTLAEPKSAGWGSKFWNLKGPFEFAHATPKPDAVVDANDWINWDADGKDRTPYIARIPYGLGSVTWVAQDLGNPQITGPNTAGWPYVWDEVFGWARDTHIANDQTERDGNLYHDNGNATDIGMAQMQGVEFAGKGTGLVVIAIFFFIGYWVVAGPGSYLFLAGKKRPELSWTAFGAAALIATIFTVLVVRLVLRGSPEIHHASDIRMALGQNEQPAIAFSRIGLYIPRDGDQHISLANTSNQFVSYVTPLAIPPSENDSEFPAVLDYHVPVHEEGSADGVSVDIPFRSTLKKLEAQWCGDTSKTIRGTGLKLNPNGTIREKNFIQGTLDNQTGVDLSNIYIVFHRGDGQDMIIYVPFWPSSGNSSRLDLAKLLTEGQLPLLGIGTGVTPDDNKVCWGNIRQQWEPYWHRDSRLKPDMGGKQVADLKEAHPVSFPLLSLYSRIPPPKTDQNSGIEAYTILRRGSRDLDMSPAIASGQLVVLAQSDNTQPLPFPLEVDGSKIGGEGTVFYQFALPLDHGGAFAPPK